MSKRMIIALVAALMMVGTALAQQIIQFYAHNDDDRTEVTIHYNSEDHVPVQAVWPALKEIAPSLPYTAMIPTFLPEGYAVEASHYTKATQTLEVMYECDGNPDYGFMLVQMPSAIELPPVDVGASAVVETAQIGDAAGQLVEGGWSVVEPTERPKGAADVQSDMVWDNAIPMFQLNWEAKDMRYTMFSTLGSLELPKNPTCLFNKDMGLKVANSLTPYTP